MIQAGIIGATGYTGSELLRILVNHPEVEVAAVSSRQEAGKPVVDLFPNLRGFLDLEFVDPAHESITQCDVIFFATPHGVAQSMMKSAAFGSARIIDLSADFRIKDIPLWEQWYGQAHGCPEKVAEAVYGLPEVNRDAIRDTKLLACPGCYPTAVQLALIPLLEADWTRREGIVADAKSGVSGAGRQAKLSMILPEVADSFKAYGASGHRHSPEIGQGLQLAAQGEAVQFTFVPHLVPMIRGIEATLYVPLNDAGRALSNDELQAHFEARYADHPFVDVMPWGSHPDTRSVRASNFCRLALHRQEEGQVIVLSVIDNLVKGAAGQAVQGMNLMYGLNETAGLMHCPVMP